MQTTRRPGSLRARGDALNKDFSGHSNPVIPYSAALKASALLIFRAGIVFQVAAPLFSREVMGGFESQRHSERENDGLSRCSRAVFRNFLIVEDLYCCIRRQSISWRRLI